jgi:hypothetical protein
MMRDGEGLAVARVGLTPITGIEGAVPGLIGFGFAITGGTATAGGTNARKGGPLGGAVLLAFDGGRNVLMEFGGTEKGTNGAALGYGGAPGGYATPGRYMVDCAGLKEGCRVGGGAAGLGAVAFVGAAELCESF